MQIKELSPGMCHTADFRGPLFESFLVTGKVITHQLPLLALQKAAGMFTGTISCKIIDHALDRCIASTGSCNKSHLKYHILGTHL